MVNEIFRDQIGRHIEVYVDDIILKSRKVNMLSHDVRETFNKIQQV